MHWTFSVLKAEGGPPSFFLIVKEGLKSAVRPLRPQQDTLAHPLQALSLSSFSEYLLQPGALAQCLEWIFLKENTTAPKQRC